MGETVSCETGQSLCLADCARHVRCAMQRGDGYAPRVNARHVQGGTTPYFIY